MEKCPIGFSGHVIIENNLWFFSKSYNGLYVLDLLTEELQWKGRVPFEATYTSQLYNKIVYWENKLFLIPFFAHRIAVYDISTSEFEAIDLPFAESENGRFFKTACLYHDKLFLFPMYDTNIVRIDLKLMEIKITNQWAEDVKPYLLNKGNPIYFSVSYAMQEGNIFLPLRYAYAVLELDCETMETTIHVIKEAMQEYGAICLDGDYFWLAPDMGRGVVVKWNRQNDHKECYSLDGIVEEKTRIVGIEKRMDEEFFKVFDRKKEELSDSLQGIIFFTFDTYFDIWETERYLTAYTGNGGNTIRIYNKETGVKKDYTPVVDYADTPLGEAFKESIVRESQVQNLSSLIEAIDSTEMKNEEEESVGGRIYQFFCARK